MPSCATSDATEFLERQFRGLAEDLPSRLGLPAGSKILIVVSGLIPDFRMVASALNAVFTRAVIGRYYGVQSIRRLELPEARAPALFVNIRESERSVVSAELGCKEWARLTVSLGAAPSIEVQFPGRHVFPTEALTLQILTSRAAREIRSERNEEEFHTDVATDPGVVAAMQHRFAGDLRTLFATLAMSTEERGTGEPLPIASGDRFDSQVASEISWILGLEIYSAASILRHLLAELDDVLETEGVSGEWGELVRNGNDIWLSLPEVDSLGDAVSSPPHI